MRKQQKIWLQNLFNSSDRLPRLTKSTSKSKSKHGAQLSFEPLEDRRLLAAVSISDTALLETDSGIVQAQFLVQLNTAPTAPASIRIDTLDGTATASSGDYSAVSGLVLNFGPSLPLSQTVNIDVIGDTLPEGDELFFVNLSQPSGLTINDSQGVATIVNDDNPALAFNGAPVFNQTIQPNAPSPGGFGLFQDSGGSVHLHSGEFTESSTDLSTAGRGFDWEFTRTYRSGVSLVGSLGHNWDFADNRRLIVANPTNLQTIQVTFPDAQIDDAVRVDGYGRADLYVNNGAGFDAPTGFFTTLEQVAGGAYEERDSSNNLIVYDAADPNGLARMLSRSDRNGNTMTYQYDPFNRLELVFDTLGRPIEYFYNGANQIQEVRDYANRSVFFQYDPNGDLQAVTSPAVVGTPTGNDFPSGKTTAYAYSFGFAEERLNHNLETITAPNEVATGGPPRVTVVYETDTSTPFTLANLDRVLVHTVGVGAVPGINLPAGGTINYSYDNYVDFGRAPVADFDADLDVDGSDFLSWQRGFGTASGATRADGDANHDQAVDSDDLTLWQDSYGRVLTSFAELDVTEVRTTVIDRNGNAAEHDFNRLGNHLAIRELTNRNVRPSDPAFFESTFEYNSDEKRVADNLSEGNTILRTYDEANSLRRLQGNLIETRRLADPDRGGDQTEILEQFVYEPIYNQLFSHVEARGLDPLHVPQNGGPSSAARYTTTYTYDYQEGTDYVGIAAALGKNQPADVIAVQQLLNALGIPMGLGDVNDDGRTDQISGNVIRAEFPSVTLLAGSNQAAVEGTTQQPIVSLYHYNDFGQTILETDPEGNVSVFDYYSEQDPDGDGFIDNPGGDPTTGGYLRQMNADVVSDPLRNSGTNPNPTNIRTSFEYDPVGNIVRSVDGRGIATDFFVNERNQVVEIIHSAAHNLLVPDPAEPEPLIDFGFVEQFEYDANDNVVRHSVEDRGDTSNTGGFVDHVYIYDILDNLIEERHEVATGTDLVTRFRYDANENQVLTIEPEGNATTTIYDERDLVFQTTRGATTPPPLVILGAGDPTNYDVRGGLSSTTTFHYDSNGNVIERVDAEDTDQSVDNNSDLGGAGDRSRYIYDGFDRLTSTVDSVGNQSVLQYDAADNVVRDLHFGPAGGASPTADGPDLLPGPVSIDGVVQTGNLVNSNLLSATEALYDELNRNLGDDRVIFVGVPTARPADVEDGATSLGKGDLTPGDNQAIPGLSGIPIQGRVSTRFEYDRNSRNTFVVEDDLDTSRTFYDGVGRVIEEVDPEGNRVEYAYDDNHNVIEYQETDVSQVPGVADEIFVHTFFYDSLNRMQREVNNLGQSVEYRYDSRSNLVAAADSQGPVGLSSITRRAFTGGALTVNSFNDLGNVTRMTYDGLNRLVVQETILTASGSGDGVSIGASLDGVKDDSAAPESFVPAPDTSQGGGDGIIRVGVTYDDNSLVSSRLDDQGNVTLYLYDNLNRQVTETHGLTTASSALGPIDKNRILGSREIVTPTTTTINNPAVIATPLIDAQLADAELRINFIAPLFPSLAAQVDDAPPTTIVYGYDPNHNLVIREDENDNEVFTRYDAIDRAIATRVFRAGQSDFHTSDLIFAPAPVSDPSNPSGAVAPTVVGTTKQDYQYDGLSRLMRAEDNNDPSDVTDDSVVDYVFDSLSRVVEESQLVDGALPVIVSSSWRAENLRSTLIYGNGREIDYTYDGLDRYQTIDEDALSQAIAEYDYIGKDRVLERTYSNGTRLTYLDATGTVDVGYDGLRRRIDLQHVGGGALIVGFQHTYDRMNNKLTEAKLHDSINNEQYTYDSAYRMVEFLRPDVLAITPEHQNFTLDGAGNWDTVDGEARDHSSNNEIVIRDDGSGSITSLSYDDNGNLLDDGTHTYQWDAFNRLRDVTRNSDGLQIAEYAYDAMGRRVRKDVTNSGALDGTTRFYYDGWQVIEERDGTGGVSTQYVHNDYDFKTPDATLLVSSDQDGDNNTIGPADQQLFYHENDQGSMYALTDASGNVVEGYLYDAYGRTTVYTAGLNGTVDFGSPTSGSDDGITIGGSSSVDNPYLYTGRRLDAETDLYYYRTRYYDTSLGRFISRDTIGIWGDMANVGNGYVYVASNPLNFVDPYGEMIFVMIPGMGDDSVQTDDKHKKWIVVDSIQHGTKHDNNNWFVADSFSFGVEREMKESGEKGGTADINIGVGELQECTISKSMDHASPGLRKSAPPQPKDYFVANSFAFGVEREMKESGEKGGTTDMNIGVGELQECTISKSMDWVSPKLAQFSTNGNSRKTAEIDFVEVGSGGAESKPLCYLKYKLDRCFVKSWSISGTGDERPTEEVAFYYNKIAWTYQSSGGKDKTEDNNQAVQGFWIG